MNDRSSSDGPPRLVITRGTATAVDHPRIIDIRRSCPSADVNESDWVLALVTAHIRANRVQITERTIAGLTSARARGRKGGRPHKMTPAKLRLAAASMGKPETNIGELCAELGISRQTLYRHLSPTGELRPDGLKLSQG